MNALPPSGLGSPPIRVLCLSVHSDDRTLRDERCFSPRTFGARASAPQSE